MNEQTETLIRELAEKFGTTAEHLWSVLVRQAPISASIHLSLWLLLTAIFGVVLWKLYQRRVEMADDCGGPAFLIAALAVSSVWFMITAVLPMDMIFAGLFNPEYWALKQVIK